jgi:protease-4
MKQAFWIVAGAVLALVALVGAAGVGGVVGFLVGVVGGAPSGPPERHLSGEGEDKIAVIRVVGPITHEGSSGLLPFLGSSASGRRIVELLDRAQHDKAVKAVVLELNTPGGSIVASDEVHQKVRVLRRERKPVVALMTETAASGGYYIAAATDHIVADATTITGSIGVIAVLPNFQELNKKIGIRTIVFKSGAFKDLGNPDRPMLPQEAAIFQQFIAEAYGRFVDIVAQGRRIDRTRVLQIADGRIYTGQQAKRLGLVDSLGHLPEAVAEAQKRAGLKQARVVEYDGEGLLRSLLGGTASRAHAWLWGPGEVARMRAPFSLQYLMVP